MLPTPSEVNVGGVYLSPLMVSAMVGFALAWASVFALNRYRLSRFFAYPPVVFLALFFVYTVVISTFVIPA